MNDVKTSDKIFDETYFKNELAAMTVKLRKSEVTEIYEMATEIFCRDLDNSTDRSAAYEHSIMAAKEKVKNIKLSNKLKKIDRRTLSIPTGIAGFALAGLVFAAKTSRAAYIVAAIWAIPCLIVLIPCWKSFKLMMEHKSTGWAAIAAFVIGISLATLMAVLFWNPMSNWIGP